MNHCIFVQNATATKYLWIHDAWYQLENWRWRCIQCVINQFRLLIYLAEWFFPNWTFFSTHTARLCDALGLRLGSMLSGWLFTWSQLAAFGGRPRVNCLLPPNALFRLAMAVGCTPMLFPECRTRLWPRVENPAATPAPEYFPKVVKALTMALSVLTSLKEDTKVFTGVLKYSGLVITDSDWHQLVLQSLEANAELLNKLLCFFPSVVHGHFIWTLFKVIKLHYIRRQGSSSTNSRN